MLWTNQYLNELILEAEVYIADKVPCIIERYGLSVDVGYNTYQLPEYIDNIRRVFWKGFRVEAASAQDIWDWPEVHYINTGTFEALSYTSNAFEAGDFGASGTVGSRPFRYFYSTYGENVIRFDRGTNETLIAGQSNLFDSAIPNTVIVEYYRVPDGVNYKIPEYIRRRTIKNYVLWKAFLKEGDGQNIKAADYYKDKCELGVAKAKKIIDNVYAAQIHTINPSQRMALPPRRPRLPWNWEAVTEDD